MSEAEASELHTLLEYLKQNRGFDFTGYKRSSLTRRILRRMQLVDVATFADYLDFLEVHPDEFYQLFNTILINVTGFFRDQSMWDYLAENILPQIVAQQQPGQSIRVWSAGCASGQEAYTLAMLLHEAVGAERYRKDVKIYATDVDDEALNEARQATYDEKQMADIPEKFVEKYFERIDHRFCFRKDLRRSVIFGRHDLVQDAPISRLNLLVCRNTLMYFNSEAQSRILNHFHFALNDDGFLFLGKSEMLLTHANRFVPVELKRRIFAKVPKRALRDRLLELSGGINSDPANGENSTSALLSEVAFDNGEVPQIVVDSKGTLILANSQARRSFGISDSDIERPFRDLEISYRPMELRSRIDSAFADRTAVTLKEVAWTSPGQETRYLEVRIVPLILKDGELLGASISFIDITSIRSLREQVQTSRQDLETAYEELQSTVEELETTNEELQSTNEELETTNEELQSTNEELETMNEELQSANEELETINEELRDRTTEINRTNSFLESILSGLRVGVVVVDKELRVQTWNHRSEDLWGLRAGEIHGEHFLNLDIGLPVEQLKQCMKSCLSGDSRHEEVTLAATNRRGKQILCTVTCTPLTTEEEGIRGLIMLMEEKPSLIPGIIGVDGEVDEERKPEGSEVQDASGNGQEQDLSGNFSVANGSREA